MRSDAEILKAIAQAESGGDPNAVGKSGEVGQYQFMPDTIRALGGDPAKLKGNAAAQDELARKHLAALRAKYGEDDNKIIAAWNAGTGGVDNAVKKGGADWQKNLPKGTNKFGAEYDTGAYVQRVNQNLPQEPMTSQPQQPQQPEQQPAPADQISVAGGPEQTLAEEYHARRRAELINWMNQGNAPEAPKPEAPKAEPAKPAGGFFNTIGKAISAVGSAAAVPGQGIADALYPAHPQGGNPQEQGVLEHVIGALGRVAGAGVHTMQEGAQGTVDLLTPSPEEAQRRQNLPIGEQIMALVKGLGDMINATPAGGVIGAAGQTYGNLASALEANTPDEVLQQQLKAAEDIAVRTGLPSDVEKAKWLKSWLMIPRDERIAKMQEAGKTAGETMASMAPMPFTLGAFGAVKRAITGSEGLLASVKAARAAAVAKAAEAAAEAGATTGVRTEADIAAAMKAASERGRVPETAGVGSQAEQMGAANKRGAVPGASEKLNAEVPQPGPQQLALPAHEGAVAALPSHDQSIAALPEHAGPTREGGAIPLPPSTKPKSWAERTPLEKLRVLMFDPEAKAAIEDTFRQYMAKPETPAPTSAPGRARVEGLTERERLRQEGRTDLSAEPRTAQPEPPKPSGPIEPWPGEIAGGGAPAAEVGVKEPSPVDRLVESTTFNGTPKGSVLGPNDNMVVALDKNGNDLGYIWYERKPGGYFVHRIETLPEHQGKGVARALDEAVRAHEGQYLGATGQTEAGKGFRAAMGKPKPAPEELYRDVRDLMQGDPDITEAALKMHGYKLPELGVEEAKAVHEAMGVAKDAAPAEKAAAAEVLHGVAADIGILPEAGTEALPAISRIMKAIPEGDLKTVKEIIGEALKNPDNPLSALRAAQAGGSEAGRVNAGTLFVLARAALGGVAGGMVGDDPQSRIRNVLLGAGIGAALSPKLARVIADNILKPDVQEALKNALTLHGEEGALRFPSRGVGDRPSPNTDRMGVSPAAKRVVRGINEQLEKLKMLNRAEVQTHAMTQEAARHSQYATVEKVLSLDSAKLSPDELASAGLAARNVRDAISEKVIEAGARVKLNPGDVALEDEFMNHMALLAKASQQVTNLETAIARAENAFGIVSDVTAASKFDLKQFAGDVELFKGALTDQGKVSAAQLADMVGNLADKASTAKLAQTASKWPPALWNIYYGLNLLSSPLTHMRNFIGNTGALGMAVMDRAGGELLGPAFRALGVDPKRTVAMGETYHMISGIVDSIADSFRAAGPKGAFGMAKDTYKTGLSKFEGGNKYTEALNASTAQQAMMAEQGPLPMIIQTMSTLGQKNMALMSASDEFFKVLSFEGEMRSLARRATQHLTGDARRTAYEALLADPTRDMLHGAEAFAQENTFTKAFKPRDRDASVGQQLAGTKGGALFGAGAQIQGLMDNPLAKIFGNAFFRTPARIGEFSTVHTPLLNMLAPQTWSDIAAGGVKAQLALSKTAVGLGMMTVAGWYAAHGYVTGAAPSDPGLRKKLEATGWQEFSVYVPDWVPGGGKYVSYANVEPVSTIVGTIATFMQIAPDMDEASIQDFFSAGTLAIGKNALNKQWWQGFSDLSDAIQAISKEGSAKAAMTWAARKAATAMPGGAAFRYVQNATDPYKHDPEIDEWKKLVDIFAQNAPGWGSRNALELAGYKPRPAALNGLTGEEVPNENQWIGLVAPFRISSQKSDPVINKIVELAGAGLPKELIPHVIAGSAPPSPFKLQPTSGQSEEERLIKEGVTLDNEQYRRLAELLTREVKDFNGNTMHEAMSEVIKDPDFEDLKGGPDGGQANKIRKIYHAFLKDATNQLKNEYPEIDYAILRRKLERDGRRMPKSMDWMLKEGRQQLQEDAAMKGVR